MGDPLQSLEIAQLQNENTSRVRRVLPSFSLKRFNQEAHLGRNLDPKLSHLDPIWPLQQRHAHLPSDALCQLDNPAQLLAYDLELLGPLAGPEIDLTAPKSLLPEELGLNSRESNEEGERD